MEMPVDILNHRLGKIRDNGDIDFDNTDAANQIDEELQRKFIFIPIEEIDAVEIVDTSRTNIHTSLQAGDGPETIRANASDNPAWLYNSAVHALAMYRHLKKQEQAEEERLAKRPEPGYYLGKSATNRFSVLVTEDRRVLVPQAYGPERFRDMSERWDSDPENWILQRIDLTDGTVQA